MIKDLAFYLSNAFAGFPALTRCFREFGVEILETYSDVAEGSKQKGVIFLTDFLRSVIQGKINWQSYRAVSGHFLTLAD